MPQLPEDLDAKVQHMQEMYDQWLYSPTKHCMSIIPAGVLAGHLQYLYEYIDALTEREDSLPVSVAWLVEQIIGAMYEYNIRR